jgi:hypothetical protein
MSFARFTSLACGVVALGVSELTSTVARAEESPSRVRAAVVDPSNTEYPVTAPSRLQLEFHGNLESDLGYAKYYSEGPGKPGDDPQLLPNDWYDWRGRFVLGADLDYGFGGNFFFHGRGQFVAWIRELAPQYQVNEDDVYLQVGQRGIWDFLVGRFMTWRVYRKGLGYDIYTLEDTGAAYLPPTTNQLGNSFAPHIYEVDNFFLRNPQGRAGFHLYPTSWSGIEVIGEYGRDGTVNTIGSRAAGKVSLGPLSAAFGAEVKHVGLVQAKPACDQCGIRNVSGYGGGLVLDLKVVEIGGNAAIETTSSYGVNDGTFDKASSGKRKSFGGYFEVDPGTLLMNRRLVLGVGLNKTDVAGDADFDQHHTQGAAYIAYPLGFNDGVVKFVVSKADATKSPPAADETFYHMYAARFRVAFSF